LSENNFPEVMVPRDGAKEEPHSKTVTDKWDTKSTTDPQGFSEGAFPPEGDGE